MFYDFNVCLYITICAAPCGVINDDDDDIRLHYSTESIIDWSSWFISFYWLDGVAERSRTSDSRGRGF